MKADSSKVRNMEGENTCFPTVMSMKAIMLTITDKIKIVRLHCQVEPLMRAVSRTISSMEGVD